MHYVGAYQSFKLGTKYDDQYFNLIHDSNPYYDASYLKNDCRHLKPVSLTVRQLGAI
jgi:hypothetical protein